MKKKTAGKRSVKEVLDRHQQTVFDRYQLDDIDKQIIKYLLDFPKLSDDELAILISLPQQKISYRKAKPAFKKALYNIALPNEEQLQKAAKKAINTLMKDLDNPSTNYRLRAADIILKYATGTIDQTVNIQPNVIFKTSINPSGSLISEIIDAEVGEDAQTKSTDGLEQITEGKNKDT